jgi:hypothetical protein
MFAGPDHSHYCGRRHPCGLHADANNGEGIAVELNRLVSGLDARTVGARSSVIEGKQHDSLQRKFFDALKKVHKIRSVSHRMENKVSLYQPLYISVDSQLYTLFVASLYCFYQVKYELSLEDSTAPKIDTAIYPTEFR